MFGLGAPEIIIILLIALVIFGPKKLPELGKSLGQGIREFRRGTSGLKEELESSFKDEPAPAARPALQAADDTATQRIVVTPREATAEPADTGRTPQA
jgi:sec-independent protein translocase protein TatA